MRLRFPLRQSFPDRTCDRISAMAANESHIWRSVVGADPLDRDQRLHLVLAVAPATQTLRPAER
jgi:hypothetical protein